MVYIKYNLIKLFKKCPKLFRFFYQSYPPAHQEMQSLSQRSWPYDFLFPKECYRHNSVCNY